MNSWILKVKYYLNKFIEVGVLLLAASVLAEIIFDCGIHAAMRCCGRRMPLSGMGTRHEDSMAF